MLLHHLCWFCSECGSVKGRRVEDWSANGIVSGCFHSAASTGKNQRSITDWPFWRGNLHHFIKEQLSSDESHKEQIYNSLPGSVNLNHGWRHNYTFYRIALMVHCTTELRQHARSVTLSYFCNFLYFMLLLLLFHIGHHKERLRVDTLKGCYINIRLHYIFVVSLANELWVLELHINDYYGLLVVYLIVFCMLIFKCVVQQSVRWTGPSAAAVQWGQESHEPTSGGPCAYWESADTRADWIGQRQASLDAISLEVL